MAATTFSLLAPAPYAVFDARNSGGALYTADGFGLITGVPQNQIRDLIDAGCLNLGAGTLNDAAAWNESPAFQNVAAAGATQGAATGITANTLYVTASASTEGVVLKAIATNALTEGYAVNKFKLYPPLNGKFDGVTSTNEAKAITANTGFKVRQRTATAYSLEFT